MAKKTTRKKATGKKTARKAAKKPARRATKKTARRAAKAATHKKVTRKKTARKARRKVSTATSQAARLKPSKVTTGRGAKPAEIGKELVAMVNHGVPDPEIWDKLFDKGFVSIEGHGMAWAGRKAVEAKNEAWAAEWKLISITAEGPYAGATGFSVKYVAEMEYRPTGKRHTQHEIGVYTVKNGKVITEEFFYGP